MEICYKHASFEERATESSFLKALPPLKPRTLEQNWPRRLCSAPLSDSMRSAAFLFPIRRSVYLKTSIGLHSLRPAITPGSSRELRAASRGRQAPCLVLSPPPGVQEMPILSCTILRTFLSCYRDRSS